MHTTKLVCCRETMNGAQHAVDTLRSRERMDVALFQDSSQASSAVAQEIAELVRKTGKAGIRHLHGFQLVSFLKCLSCAQN